MQGGENYKPLKALKKNFVVFIMEEETKRKV